MIKDWTSKWPVYYDKWKQNAEFWILKSLKFASKILIRYHDYHHDNHHHDQQERSWYSWWDVLGVPTNAWEMGKVCGGKWHHNKTSKTTCWWFWKYFENISGLFLSFSLTKTTAASFFQLRTSADDGKHHLHNSPPRCHQHSINPSFYYFPLMFFEN